MIQDLIADICFQQVPTRPEIFDVIATTARRVTHDLPRFMEGRRQISNTELGECILRSMA